ncbi:MAG: DUF29 domain-containing protein [Cyanophyceae cyanobacterium]
MKITAKEKDSDTLYDTDFYQWTQEQAKAIAAKDFENIDWKNLQEEIEALGRLEKREVKSLQRQLLIHLLLYQFWIFNRDYYTKSWAKEILTFRIQLEDDLAPKTLYNYFASEANRTYKQAKKLVEQKYIEAGLESPVFPEQCPYTVEQLLDEEFLPEHKR